MPVSGRVLSEFNNSVLPNTCFDLGLSKFVVTIPKPIEKTRIIPEVIADSLIKYLTGLRWRFCFCD